MTAPIAITQDDLTAADVRALVAYHLGQMQAWSPPDKVHALPIEALRQPGVTFWVARVGSSVAGMGALKHLDAGHGEVKSMRVAADFLGQGIDEALLVHLLGEARARGYARVSLETGRTAPFAPAEALYRKHGFVSCPPFADYVSDDFSQCLSVRL